MLQHSYNIVSGGEVEQVPQAVNNLHVMRRGLTKPLNWVRSLELRYSVLEEADTSLPDCTDMLVCSGYCLILFCHQDGRLSSCSSPLSPKGPVFCKSFSLFFFFSHAKQIGCLGDSQVLLHMLLCCFDSEITGDVSWPPLHHDFAKKESGPILI